LKENHQYFLAVGILGEENQLIFDHQLFMDEKPNYYDFSNETAKMTGEEFFAQFATEEV
jgi:hypothetical protein